MTEEKKVFVICKDCGVYAGCENAHKPKEPFLKDGSCFVDKANEKKGKELREILKGVFAKGYQRATENPKERILDCIDEAETAINALFQKEKEDEKKDLKNILRECFCHRCDKVKKDIICSRDCSDMKKALSAINALMNARKEADAKAMHSERDMFYISRKIVEKEYVKKEDVLRVIDDVEYGETIPSPTMSKIENNLGRYILKTDGSIESVDVKDYVFKLKKEISSLGEEENQGSK
jgi:hypothetical protein